MRHKLLCCSDTHGSVPPALDESGALAWLHGGDVCNGPDLVDVEGDPIDDLLLAPVARWFAERPIPVHIVPGNHDVADPYRAFQRCSDLNGRLVKLADRLFVGGIGWHGERYFELPFERDLKPACEMLLRQARRMLFENDRLVLLTHYPPRFRGTHEVPNDVDGGGVWYDCIREVVEALPTLAIVQGHNHRWFGDTHRVSVRGRELLIVNPGPRGCILKIDPEAGDVAMLDG